MAKLLIILLIGLVFESTGVILLKKGMSRVAEVKTVSVPEIGRVFKAGVTSPYILCGVFFEALFFGCLLILMSRSDISFFVAAHWVKFRFRDLCRDVVFG